MDRLKYVLFISGVFPLVAGGFVTAVMALGYYTLPAILIAGGAGLILAVPLSYLVSRKIKREDPNFDHRDPPEFGVMPDPDAREA